MMLSRIVIFLSFYFFTIISVAQGEQLSAEMIKQRLKDGGYVVYFRHAATTWMGVDKIEWPREKQRLLSEQGIEDSKKIGAAFRNLAIPVTEVYASPFARCHDMAEIAFGGVEVKKELLGLLSDDDGVEIRRNYLRQQLSSPLNNGNRILISHSSNIREVAGVRLGEGEAVMIEPQGEGGFTVLGVMRVSDW